MSAELARIVHHPEVLTVEWANWDDVFEKMPQMPREYEEVVIEEMRHRGLRFTGDSHQHRPGCAPVVAGRCLALSMRGWGGLMAEILHHREGDPYAYVDWAWSAPEEEVFP